MKFFLHKWVVGRKNCLITPKMDNLFSTEQGHAGCPHSGSLPPESNLRAFGSIMRVMLPAGECWRFYLTPKLHGAGDLIAYQTKSSGQLFYKKINIS